MSVSKDPQRGTYYVQCWYKDWTGKRCKKTKRGFKTKKAATSWEVDFLRQMEGTPDMTLNAFYGLYCKDMEKKLRNTTKLNKANMIESKILPYLGEKKLTENTPLDILNWQNAIQDERTSNGLHYATRICAASATSCPPCSTMQFATTTCHPTPMSKVDRMGSKKTEEMKFWTKDEYKAFSREIMDKDASFLLFELLYWLGIRSGEALALMPKDFDFKRNRVSITKTYVRLNGQDVFNPPKTKKSVRTIVMPQFLADEVQDYLIAHPFIKPDDRLTNATKNFLTHEMERGCKQSGVRRIRIHDLRHSHVSLLIEMGFSALAIAERLGHESTEVTMMYAHLFPNKQEEMAEKLETECGPMAAALFEEARAMKEVRNEREEHR